VGVGATVDLIVAPGDGVMTTAHRPEGTFASDAAWAWVRHDGAGAPDVAGVIQGRHLHLGADTILAGASLAAADRWAVAAWRGGAWHRVAGGSGAVPTSRPRGATTTTTSEDG
jgi:hypothetical protein